MKIGDKLKAIGKARIKIYPEHDESNLFAVVVEDPSNKVFKNKISKGQHKYSSETINEAILKTVDFVSEKLTG